MNTRPRKKTAYFGIKIEPKLKQRVEQHAKQIGVDVSSWLRAAIELRLSIGDTHTVRPAK